jgi:hypothetical protein
VNENQGQTYALQTIAKDIQIIAVQTSRDGVATALINASHELSGARGAVVLASKGAMQLAENGFELGVPLFAKLKRRRAQGPAHRSPAVRGRRPRADRAERGHGRHCFQHSGGVWRHGQSPSLPRMPSRTAAISEIVAAITLLASIKAEREAAEVLLQE